jgi:hypothetical protein
MIKFRRGSTKSWRGDKTKLEPGQPGYDKNKHKLKVGDGEKLWSDLPYATGLFAEEILSSEADAQANRDKDDKFATNIITYGTNAPDENTLGQIYLQQIAEPEVDYVIESGTNDEWTYQKWKSGIAKCWRNYSFKTTVQEHLELFCRSTDIGYINYPIKLFIAAPTETATIQSSGGQVLLANSGANTKEHSGTYTIISLTGEIADADYRISIQVEGFWRTVDGNKD